MTGFWIAATGLALVAAGCVLWPLWVHRADMGRARGATNIDIFNERMAELDAQLQAGELDVEAHRAMQDELKLSLLSDTDGDALQATTVPGGQRVLLVCAVLVPLVGGAWYWSQGASQDVLLRDQMQAMQGPEDAQAVADLLRARLDEKPDNAQNWFTLARLYMDMGRYADATMAYLEVVNREPEAGSVIAEMAQALFLASNNQMTPEVQRITERALSLAPNNTTALGLAGIAAFEQRQYQAAIDHWQLALAATQPESPGYQALQGGVERARVALGESAPATTDAAEQAAGPESIKVSVALADAVPRQGQTVFVYVRAWQGAKMPLAIERLSIDQLPTSVVLDDSKAMMAGTSLAKAGQLEVVVRVSASGNPVASAGDWQVSEGPVSLSEGPVSLALTVREQVR